MPTLDAIRACRDVRAAAPGTGTRRKSEVCPEQREVTPPRKEQVPVPSQQDFIGSGYVFTGEEKENLILYLFSVHLDEQAGLS